MAGHKNDMEAYDLIQDQRVSSPWVCI